MKLGVIIPQGWVGEYDGWDAIDAWRRTTQVAMQAEILGFESLWLFDHFHTTPNPTDEITFESFTALAALGAMTKRARLGHLVICTGFRNAALTAKMISTMDTITGGRIELGIGAGWKKDEWIGYGYDYPETKERLARLGDDLEVFTRMLGGDKHQHADFSGTYARVRDARNIPKPVQRPRVPITIGGNGPSVTWRLAARFADELNLDGMGPQALSKALPVIHSRCEEIGRDPASLAISVHIWTRDMRLTGGPRAERLAAFAELGVSRVMGLIPACATSDEALESFVEDARDAGIELA